MKYTFGFIGCGNMGGTLACAVAKQNPEMNIAVCDALAEKAIRFANQFSNIYALDITETVQNCKYLVLGVKPQMLGSLADEIHDDLKRREKDLIIVSMLAGKSTKSVSDALGVNCPLIRIMPNTSAALGKGIVLYCTNNKVEDADLNLFTDALSGAGLVDAIEEDKIDAASAVTGCGPAFAYMFIEALSDGAVECGLARNKAIKYAAAMLEGAGAMVLAGGKHPGELKDAVCSPGGSTIAGVHSLENDAFRAACINAVTSAYEKTLDLK